MSSTELLPRIGHKDTRQLVRRALEVRPDLDLVPTTGGHFYLQVPNGARISFGGTASDYRAVNNLRGQLKAAGIDPDARPERTYEAPEDPLHGLEVFEDIETHEKEQAEAEAEAAAIAARLAQEAAELAELERLIAEEEEEKRLQNRKPSEAILELLEENPNRKFSVDDIVSATRLPKGKINPALQYLLKTQPNRVMRPERGKWCWNTEKDVLARLEHHSKRIEQVSKNARTFTRVSSKRDGLIILEDCDGNRWMARRCDDLEG